MGHLVDKFPFVGKPRVGQLIVAVIVIETSLFWSQSSSKQRHQETSPIDSPTVAATTWSSNLDEQRGDAGAAPTMCETTAPTAPEMRATMTAMATTTMRPSAANTFQSHTDGAQIK